MQIEIIEVVVENKGKYRVANVAYKTGEGKVEGKKVMSFTHKDVFKTVSEAQQGDILNVKSAKNDQGYWEWTEAAVQGKNTGVETTNKTFTKAAQSGRDFETSEERAKKQVYIVRQSSVSAAIALAELNKAKGPVTEGDIVASAKKFEEYVFGVGKVVAEEVEVA